MLKHLSAVQRQEHGSNLVIIKFILNIRENVLDSRRSTDIDEDYQKQDYV